MSLLEGGSNTSESGGLNDDTLSEFAENAHNVQLPDPDDSNPVMAIIADTPDPTTDVDAVIAAMPNYDAKIVALVDGEAKVHDVSTLSAQLLTTESIGQGDAEEIAAMLPELQDEVAAVNEYSQVPTRTNLEATQRFVTRKLEELKTQRNADLRAFLETEFKAIMTLDLMTITAELIAELDRLQALSVQDLQVVTASKAFFAVKKEGDDRTVDIRSIPLQSIDSEQYEALPSYVPTHEALTGLISILRSAAFVTFDHTVSTHPCEHIRLAMLCPEPCSIEAKEWRYLDLLAFFSTGAHKEALSTLCGLITKESTRVASAMSEGGDLSGAVAVLNEVSCHRVAFLQIIQKYRLLTKYASLVLSTLSNNVER